ncbi:hypothetical protein HOY82DRAFT_491295, partial [Tuber indicum]
TGVRQAVLSPIGLPRKTSEDTEKELNLPPAQVLAMFQKSIRKIATCLRHLRSQTISKMLPQEGRKIESEKGSTGGDSNNETEKPGIPPCPAIPPLQRDSKRWGMESLPA